MMKSRNHKKIIVASALIAGTAVGGAAIASNQMASAMSESGTETQTNEQHKRPELSEEKKAEIREKLAAMTEEEKQEWLENHKPKGGGRAEGNGRPGKPANLTDEEWEQKKAELKEKLAAMTDEERKEWLENHKPKDGKEPKQSESAKTSGQIEQPAEASAASSSEE